MKKLLAGGLALLLVGCANKDMNDLQVFVDEVKARPPSGIEPIPEVKQIVGFVYTAKNRRDPFTPQVDEDLATETDDLFDLGDRLDT